MYCSVFFVSTGFASEGGLCMELVCGAAACASGVSGYAGGPGFEEPRDPSAKHRKALKPTVKRHSHTDRPIAPPRLFPNTGFRATQATTTLGRDHATPPFTL